jgi:hypothetical protein
MEGSTNTFRYDITKYRSYVATVSWLPAEDKGYEPFLYDIAGGTSYIQFDCQEWEDNTGRAGLRSVSATFKQSFVLVS